MADGCTRSLLWNRSTSACFRHPAFIIAFALLWMDSIAALTMNCHTSSSSARTMACDESIGWLRKPAIVWQKRSTGDLFSSEDEALPCYWRDLAFLTTPLHNGADAAESVDGMAMSTPMQSHQRTSVAITYQTLIYATAHLVIQLRQKIRQCAPLPSFDENIPSIGLPIAVAIPEGPLLPLVILAVHCLNHPFRLGQRDGAAYHGHAVMIPIEPSQDAKQRIAHMMEDSRPLLVLSTSQGGADYQILRSTVDRDAGNSNGNAAAEGRIKPTSSARYMPAEKSHLVDLHQLCQSMPSINLDMEHQIYEVFRVDSDSTKKGKARGDHISLKLAINFLADTWDDSDRMDSSSASTISAETHTIPNDIASHNRLSHMVYTSGTTGWPKGCMSSIQSLDNYLRAKNEAHSVTSKSTVLLASALSFDPCMSDVLATFLCQATLAIAPRSRLVSHLSQILRQLHVTHLLCTPTLFRLVQEPPSAFPQLRTLALGGEPIPASIRRVWGAGATATSKTECKLFATYGVTEACVYQTMGEVCHSPSLPASPSSLSHAQAVTSNQAKAATRATGKGLVGLPFPGMHVQICVEAIQDRIVPVAQDDGGVANGPDRFGEIVLSGNQLDEFSGYWNRNDLHHKFICETQSAATRCFYRTGDRGYVDHDGSIHVMGRIQGEEGMIKHNGVRIELNEIAAAMEEWPGTSSSIVQGCVVVARTVPLHQGSEQSGASHDDGDGAIGSDDDTKTEIHAYVVLTDSCLRSMGVRFDSSRKQPPAYLISTSPLWTLLRAACLSRIKSACVPSSFVLISQIPLSPTGKRDNRQLPRLQDCLKFNFAKQANSGIGNDTCDDDENSGDDEGNTPLAEYGNTGRLVAEQIIECLNLQQCQQSMLTIDASFGMLGGDSLAATRITRALYAMHHNINNTRHLGGEYGTLEGPFNVVHILRATKLKHYIDMLDDHNVCSHAWDHEKQSGTANSATQTSSPSPMATTDVASPHDAEQQRLYDALLQACTLQQTDVAIGLLQFGADPNWGAHGGRLGKTSGRIAQKQIFRSSPLHLAAAKGDARLVHKLLACDAKWNTPDASGLYPLHLAAASHSRLLRAGLVETNEDDQERLDCVKMLLQSGSPIKMRDGNKQSVLHCAARAGHTAIVEYVMQERMHDEDANPSDHDFNCFDRWYRTPAHWAVLNGHAESLAVLLQHGCHPDPPKPKVNRKSSAAVESPMEMCERIHGDDSEVGRRMMDLLMKTQRGMD